MSKDLSYRINTNVGKNEDSFNIDFQMNQTYDMFEILSLKLTQKSLYSLSSSNTGVIVGRVLAGSKDFGIPNAKVSVFIPYENIDDVKKYILYHYESSTDTDNGIRYNLLPEDIDEICHQDVGTFYNKEFLLDNKDLIEIFDKYYKYTTTTNNAGDYMIYGVPIGAQTLHVDIDLSDIGILSQRPRDMVNKGYNINQFESPNKFKKSKNLNQLVQIYTQDKGLEVFPFWGDTTEDESNASITRCDIKIDYEFEPTCVFMGSIVTDGNGNAISKKCVPDNDSGKMSELITGEGMIEMIRKTPDGKVQEFNIKGGRLIDSDGTWCYQIPMNLDYVRTDEYGNMIPTDNPDSGIPTRARVRFRISIDEVIDTDSASKKRARFLVPNNPRYDSKRYPEFTKSSHPDADYEFGSFTKDENFCDLFMNKVYTVKSYIPRIQKTVSPNRLHFTGIKAVNHYGSNNPMPYNNLQIKFNITFRILCVLSELFVGVIGFINRIFSRLYTMFAKISRRMKGFFPGDDIATFFLRIAVNFQCISVTGLCDDGNEYFPKCSDYETGFGALWFLSVKPYGTIYALNVESDGAFKDVSVQKKPDDTYSANPISSTDLLFNCIESGLSEDNQIIRFNFQNDWINGVLYAPMWYRHIKSKRKFFFNLIKLKAKDQWCSADKRVKGSRGIKLYHTCALPRNFEYEKDKNGNIIKKTLKKLPDSNNVHMKKVTIFNQEIKNVTHRQQNETNSFGFKAHKRSLGILKIEDGLIKSKETKYGQTVFYYKAIEYNKSNLLSSQNYIDYELKRIEDAKPKKERNEQNYIKTFTNPKGDFVKLLFATDIVLLGSLNDNDVDGTPQFFKNLPSTTYNMPNTLLTEEINDKEIELNNIETSGSNAGFQISMATIEDFSNNANSKIENLINLQNLNTNLYFSDKSENVSESYDDKYTDTTGADWGNHGLDQNFGAFYRKYLNENNKKLDYEFDTEILDDGGLFYGLNCNFAFVKPKSCENLKRICEYGVQLDSNIEVPDMEKIKELQNDPNLSNKKINYNEIYKILIPDGYISYDEIYDHDGRSMFATMNGNYLKTRVNPMTGFKVYDFEYTYIQNFDGSMRTIMEFRHGKNGVNEENPPEHWGNLSNGEKPTYLYNYVMEELDENYMRFRYGEKLYFYLPSDSYNMIFGSAEKDSKDKSANTNNFITFPRYENSFYFYFGLKPGSTAIDKFRTQFYSECTSDETEKPIFDIEVQSNSWCSNGENKNKEILNDGYVAIKTRGLSKPYTLRIVPLSNSSTEECFKENIDYDNIYIGIKKNIDSKTVSSKLYTYVNIELQKNKLDETIVENEIIDRNKIKALNNGSYLFTFIDSNGIEFDNEVEIEQDYLTYKYSVKDFTETNEVLISVYENNENIANQNDSSRGNLLDRKIGGYIVINDIMNNDELMGGDGEQYQIIVRPNNPKEISSTLGKWDGVCVVPFEISKTLYEQGVYNKDLVPFANTGNNVFSVNGLLKKTNSSCIIGVPKGGIYYDIIITQICPSDSCSCNDPTEEKFWENGYTQNSVKQTVLVGSPKPIHFLINDVDYRFISLFETGWYAGPQIVDAENPKFVINTQRNGIIQKEAASWLNLSNIMNTPNFDDLKGKTIFCPDDDLLSKNYEDIKVYFESLNKKYTLSENQDSVNALLTGDMPMFIKTVSSDKSEVKYLKYSNNVSFYEPYEEISNENLSKLCYYNWPINYCYHREMNENIWNGLNEQERKEEVDKVNSLIQKRLDISRKVRAAFSKSNNNGYNIELKLENQESFNNKFLISYVEDTLVDGKPSFVNYKDDYSFLEESKLNENYFSTIRRKKIGSEIVSAYITEYTNENFLYKKPYYVGCITNDKTYPISFTAKDYEIKNMVNLFGVHIIDKPFTNIFRNWVFSKKLQESIKKEFDNFEGYNIMSNKAGFKLINGNNQTFESLEYNEIIKYNTLYDAKLYINSLLDTNVKLKKLFYIKGIFYYCDLANNFYSLTSKNGYENISINLVYKNGNNSSFINNPFLNSFDVTYINEDDLYNDIKILSSTTLYSLGNGNTTYYKKEGNDIIEYTSDVPQFLWKLPSKITLNISKKNMKLEGKPMSFLIGKFNNGVESSIEQYPYGDKMINLLSFKKNTCGNTNLKIELTNDKEFANSLTYSPYYVEERNNIMGITVNKNIPKEEIPENAYVEPVDQLTPISLGNLGNNSNSSSVRYKKVMFPLMDNYNFDIDKNKYGFNAVPIEYKTQEIEIEELSGNKINYNVYGNLELNILENSLDEIDENTRTSTLYLKTNSSDSETIYYVSYDETKYTLDNIITKNGNYNYLDAKTYNDYDIFKLEEDFSKMIKIENTNEIPISFSEFDHEYKLFIVAQTGISYTLSPILDFNFQLLDLSISNNVMTNNKIIKIQYLIKNKDVNFINEKCILSINFSYINPGNVKFYTSVRQEIEFNQIETIGTTEYYVNYIKLNDPFITQTSTNFAIESAELIDPYGLKHKCILN